MGLVNIPDTFLQPWLLPPQTPHLSNFFLEFTLPSQPASRHRPWTHTPAVSGEHGVPSTTCKGTRSRRRYTLDLLSPRGVANFSRRGSYLRSEDVEVSGPVSAAD